MGLHNLVFMTLDVVMTDASFISTRNLFTYDYLLAFHLWLQSYLHFWETFHPYLKKKRNRKKCSIVLLALFYVIHYLLVLYTYLRMLILPLAMENSFTVWTYEFILFLSRSYVNKTAIY